jgi:hypothetical protein
MSPAKSFQPAPSGVRQFGWSQPVGVLKPLHPNQLHWLRGGRGTYEKVKRKGKRRKGSKLKK